MELSHKTTLLLAPELHRRITAAASAQGVSMGHLIRQALEERYGGEPGREERLAAARELVAMALPVSDPATMKRESVPDLGRPLP